MSEKRKSEAHTKIDFSTRTQCVVGLHYKDAIADWRMILKEVSDFNASRGYDLRILITRSHPLSGILHTEGKHVICKSLFDLLDLGLEKNPSIILIDEREFPKHDGAMMSRFLHELTRVLVARPMHFLIMVMRPIPSYVREFCENYHASVLAKVIL